MNASGWSRIGRALLAGALLLWAGLAAAKGPLYLWELRDGEGTLRAWLYGTIHVCDATCFPLPADVRAAFAGADSLALELDPEDPGLTRLLMQAARLPAGERLDDILPPALRPRVALAMDRLGLPQAVLQGMQPWMVSTLLTLKAAERAGYGAGQGIDLSLARDARARGIELWPLERVEQQVAALSAGGDKAQVAYLTEVVSLIEDDAAPEYFAAMLHAWRTGDVAEIDRILREESGGPDAAPLLEALLDARNVEMAEAIERGLKPGRRPFIAVGAGHIGGKGGLLEILAARGYALRQVHDAND